MTAEFREKNPYIGSRSFEKGQRLYGRDGEARELTALLIAERIVLMYSPSGAGKTSLIQAALIPRLERRRFRVRPTIRVNRAPDGAGNRYIQSVIASLEEDPALPAETRPSPAELAGMSLDEYLERRRPSRDEDDVLIFDQFEEVVTVDPTDLAEKHAFFEELGTALRVMHRWALFAIREDYLATLGPFVRPIPTRLSNTFRLDLLGLAAAQQAMRGPADAVGVDFTAEAARQLAENLARLEISGRDGQKEERIGLTVEPVQLQVVCRRLWDQRFGAEHAGSGDVSVATPARPAITVGDVLAMGAIDQALSDYYADGVARAVAAGGDERAIRTWFDRELITRQDIRGQVLYGSDQMRGLSDAVLGALRNAYLIRTEERRGSVWYELAHDRLIKPVRESNRVWFERNLSLLQRHAELWSDSGQPDSMLLRGAELREAEQWAASAAHLKAHEQALLQKSIAARARGRLLIGLTVMSALLALVALVFFFQASASEARAIENYNKAQTQEALAIEQKGIAEQNERNAVAAQQTAEANRLEAERNARISKARELAAAALTRLSIDPELSVLLAMQALNATSADDPPVPAAFDALQQAANASWVRRTITLDDLSAINLETATMDISPAGTELATIGSDGALRVWSLSDPAAPFRQVPAHSAGGTALAYSPDGRWLYSGAEDGLLQLWDANSLELRRSVSYVAELTSAYPLPDDINPVSFSATRSATFSDDGSRLAVTNRGSNALILASPTLELQTVITTSGDILGLALSPDNRTLALAEPFQVTLWDAESGAALGAIAHSTFVYAVAFSPDGSLLASSDSSGSLRLWQIGADDPEALTRPLLTIVAHAGSALDTFFADNGTWLASAGNDGAIKLWDPITGQLLLSLNGHSGTVRMIARSADSRRIASAARDNTLKVWSLDRFQSAPVQSIAYAGDLLVSSGREAQISIRQARDGQVIQQIRSEGPRAPRVAVSNDGALIAQAGPAAALWSRQNPDQPLLRLPADTRSVAFDGAAALLVSSDEGTLRLWNTATLTETARVGIPDRTILSVAIAQDGSLVASGDADGQVQIWDAQTLEPIGTPIEFANQINRVLFSPDAAVLAVAGSDAVVRIYQVADPSRIVLLEDHRGAINDLAFDTSGTLIASVSNDQTLRIWQSADGTLLETLTISAEPDALAWSPDDRTLAVAGSDGIIRLIPIARDDLIDYARRQVSRPQLTSDECREYAISLDACVP